jgi:hypothetical protein
MPQADEIFEEHRPALARLAYRMLGSLADSDDVLQAKTCSRLAPICFRSSLDCASISASRLRLAK